jgi:hypothetical protein
MKKSGGVAEVLYFVGVPKIAHLNLLHRAMRLRNFLLRFTKA